MSEAEYSVAGAMRSRTVHGPGVDDPLAWYSGAVMDSTTLRFLHADRQGSIALLGDAAGNAVRIFAYDEYGTPMASGAAGGLLPDNGARHLYTGQAWMPGMGMYYYKARMYSPTLGRFMQTDPIGYEDQMNLYAYVGGDPMNRSDPSGMEIVATAPCSTEIYNANGGTCLGNGWLGSFTFELTAGALSDAQIAARLSYQYLDDSQKPKSDGPCPGLQKASDDATAKANLRFLTGNKNWDNPQTLEGYRNLYQQNLSEWQWWAGPEGQAIIGAASTAATFFPLARVGTYGVKAAFAASVATGAATSWTVTNFLNSQIAYNQNNIDAIDARLAVLNTGCK